MVKKPLNLKKLKNILLTSYFKKLSRLGKTITSFLPYENINKKDKSCTSHRLRTLSNIKRIRQNLSYWNTCMIKFNNEFPHRQVDEEVDNIQQCMIFNFVGNY